MNLVYNETMLKVNIHEAKTHLSRYLNKLKKGESILICKRNQPIAEIRPFHQPLKKRRPIGLAKGQVHIPPEFFRPLPPEALESFEGQMQ